MLVKALGDNLYREDRWCWLSFVINRKKEEFDALADSVVSMPVGQMEHTIQDYLESQVCNSKMAFSADGPLSGRNHQDFCRCRCTRACSLGFHVDFSEPFHRQALPIHEVESIRPAIFHRLSRPSTSPFSLFFHPGSFSQRSNPSRYAPRSLSSSLLSRPSSPAPSICVSTSSTFDWTHQFTLSRSISCR